MKVATVIAFVFLLCTVAPAQNNKTTFSLTDTVFRVGSVYTACDFLQTQKGQVPIRPEEQPCFDSVATFIIQHPGIILEICCFTNVYGGDSANILWSQTRAEEVAFYLRSRGVPLYSVAPVGYGERFPIWTEEEIMSVSDLNKREDMGRENRRIEFTILRTPRLTFTLQDTTFQVGAVLNFPFKYDLGKAKLDSCNFPFLDSLAALLLAHPELEIRVENHLDSRWSPASSDHLSSNRSSSIVTYLSGRGVPNYRMTPMGYADVRPVVTDRTIELAPGQKGKEVLHALNRSTEIRIMAVNPPVQFFRLTDTLVPVRSLFRSYAIKYDTSKTPALLPSSCVSLDSVAAFMISHPGIIVEIGDHTDVPKTHYMTTWLSQARAVQVKTYLISKGVPATALVAVGYGETRPLWTDPIINAEPDADRQKKMHEENKRTEFRILFVPQNAFRFNDATFTESSTLFLPVRFTPGTTTLDSISYPFLDSLAAFLVRNPQLTVELVHYTETRMPDSESNCISCKRVAVITTYLIAKGVSKDQLHTQPYHYSQPVVSVDRLYKLPSDAAMNETDAINQRLEIKITGIKP